MADLHNPLFENEKEFLERQKLEYERALLSDVTQIKAKTQQASKIALMGAGVLGGIWLISKSFGGIRRKSDKKLAAPKKHKAKKRLASAPAGAGISTDDLGFGSTTEHNRAQIAPDVYHTDAPETDPFPPLPLSATTYDAPRNSQRQASQPEPEDGEGFSSIVADGFQAFLRSDTGKMLMAQATAVIMAYAAKKVGEYLPLIKNPDLATPHASEPEVRDIDFTYHHDDADAPHHAL